MASIDNWIRSVRKKYVTDPLSNGGSGQTFENANLYSERGQKENEYRLQQEKIADEINKQQAMQPTKTYASILEQRGLDEYKQKRNEQLEKISQSPRDKLYQNLFPEQYQADKVIGQSLFNASFLGIPEAINPPTQKELQTRQQYPLAQQTGEILGSIAPNILVEGALAKGLSKVAPYVSSTVSNIAPSLYQKATPFITSKNLLPDITRAALKHSATGAGSGYITGLVSGGADAYENNQDVLQGAIDKANRDAIIGGVVGGVIGGAGRGVKNVYRSGIENLNNVFEAPKLMNPSSLEYNAGEALRIMQQEARDNLTNNVLSARPNANQIAPIANPKLLPELATSKIPLSAIPKQNIVSDSLKEPQINYLKPTTLDGKFKPTKKEILVNKATQELYDAIKTIQDYFGTNQLRASEEARIKPELGIDLDKLYSNIEEAQGFKFKLPDSQRMNMQRVVGIYSPAQEKIANQINFEKNVAPSIVNSFENLKDAYYNPLRNKGVGSEAINPSMTEPNSFSPSQYDLAKGQREVVRPVQFQASPNIKTGAATWTNNGVDYPVNVTGYAGSFDGNQYVNIEGSKTAIPINEISYINNSDKIVKSINPDTNTNLTSNTTSNAALNSTSINQNPNRVTVSNLNINQTSGGKVPPSVSIQVGNPNQSSGQRFIDKIVPSKLEDNRSYIQKAKDAFRGLFTKFTDSNYGITSLDDSIKILADNSQKINGTVSHIFLKNLVDKNLNVIGDSYQSIVNKIPTGGKVVNGISEKEAEFLEYLLNQHNIDRFAEGKVLNSNITDVDSLKQIKSYEQKNPNAKAIANELYDWVNKFADAWMVDTGLTTAQVMSDLRGIYRRYIPANRYFSDVEKISDNNNASKGFSDQGDSIYQATGSDRLIINPIENIMNMVNRTVRISRKNEVARSVYDKVLQNPSEMKKYAEILQNPTDSDLKLDNVVEIMDNGNPVYLKINDKIVRDAMIGLTNNRISIPFFSTMSKVLKSVTTDYNPIFGFFATLHDIPRGFVKSDVNNPLKYVGDLYKSGRDMLKNTPEYQKYQASGGQSSTLYSSDDSIDFLKQIQNKKTFLPKTLQSVKEIVNSLKNFNDYLENIGRFAEFKRVLDKTGDVQKALYQAGEIQVNYSRGGTWSRNIDQVVPWFKASINSLDDAISFIKKNPKKFFVKGGAVFTVPTAISELYNNVNDPETYNMIDNRIKDLNWIITTSNGNYISIPKTRDFGLILSNLFQRLYRAYDGDKNAFKGLSDTAKNSAFIVDPFESNILSPFITNLPSGKDFANRDIVPRYMLDSKTPNYLQYDENTTKLAKELGDKLNLSPMEIDYIMKTYLGVIAQVSQPMMRNDPNPLGFIANKVYKNTNYSNQSIKDFYDNRNEATSNVTEETRLKKVEEGVSTPNKEMKKAFDSVASSIKDVKDKIKAIDSMNISEESKKKLILDQQRLINNYVKKMNSAMYKNNADRATEIASDFKYSIN